MEVTGNTYNLRRQRLEIARLHNSLKHLRETQDMLREYQSSEAPGTTDPEVQKALEENEVVM